MQTITVREPLLKFGFVLFLFHSSFYTVLHSAKSITIKMWPVIAMVARRYAVTITLPIAAVVGFIGYHIEGWVSDRHTPATAPITQQRQDRLLENIDTTISKKKHNPLEVNLSPSLSQ